MEIVRILPYFQEEMMVQEDTIEFEKLMAWSKKQTMQVLISRLAYKPSRLGLIQKQDVERKQFTAVDYIDLLVD